MCTHNYNIVMYIQLWKCARNMYTKVSYNEALVGWRPCNCASAIYCREEASRMWQQREQEWEREKRARERLMTQVGRNKPYNIMQFEVHVHVHVYVHSHKFHSYALMF